MSIGATSALGLSPTHVLAADDLLPSFLPAYFLPLLRIGPAPLKPVKPSGPSSASFITSDAALALTVTYFSGEGSPLKAFQDANFSLMIAKAKRYGGKILDWDSDQFRVSSSLSEFVQDEYAFTLAGGGVVWSIKKNRRKFFDADKYFLELSNAINRWRYEQAAYPENNVEFGRWAPKIYSYAKQLKADGSRDLALSVLQKLALWDSTNFAAQADLAEITPSAAAAKASATVVYQRTEDAGLRARAARLLARQEPTLADIPLLQNEDNKLQVVLVPIDSCDLTLLAEAAKVCEKILDTPVVIRRLKAPLKLNGSERPWRAKDAQLVILAKDTAKIDFGTWTKDDYIKAMEGLAAQSDPVPSFQLGRFIADFKRQPGQLRSDLALDAVLNALQAHSTNAYDVMYVAVTDRGIYSGDFNFLFSVWGQSGNLKASLLSYDKMLAKNAGDAHESRQRLAERLAKEMVPAALKSLNLPRPVDPSDPYSYADSVGRLDEKSLALSEQTLQALRQYSRQTLKPGQF